MNDPDSTDTARLWRRAVVALLVGIAGVIAAVVWLLGLREDGAVALAPGAAQVQGREAFAIAAAVGATGLAFLLYGLVLAWGARRIDRLGTRGDGNGA